MLNKILGNSSVSQNTDTINHFLSEDENVINSFTIWRDELIVTNKGIYYVNKQGMAGKKTMTKFFPGKDIEGFAFQGTGTFDLGGTLVIYLRTNMVDGVNTKTISLSVRKEDTTSTIEMLKIIKDIFM